MCFVKTVSRVGFCAVIAYVDDLIVIDPELDDITLVRDGLKEQFEIKEIGELRYCLGIEVRRDRATRTLELNQRGYIRKIAERFQLADCKPTAIPADPNAPLTAKTDAPLTHYPYRELVGS
ncbi:putative reverse transcriptase, RNA-dependent DNA polymerase [Plasmopara halstedii]